MWHTRYIQYDHICVTCLGVNSHVWCLSEKSIIPCSDPKKILQFSRENFSILNSEYTNTNEQKEKVWVAQTVFYYVDWLLKHMCQKGKENKYIGVLWYSELSLRNITTQNELRLEKNGRELKRLSFNYVLGKKNKKKIASVFGTDGLIQMKKKRQNNSSFLYLREKSSNWKWETK